MNLVPKLKGLVATLLPQVGDETDWWAGCLVEGQEFDINIFENDAGETHAVAYMVIEGNPMTGNPIPLL